MPLSDWLRDIAVRGFLIVAVAFVASLHAQENNPQQQPQASQSSGAQQQPAQNAPPPADRQTPVEPDWSKPNCKKPQNHDEADLCQQIRMAKAAEQTVTLNQIQVGIGVVGGFLLFWTLFYSRRAAHEAGRAADAATDGAKIAERGLTSIERAFVFLKNAYASPVLHPKMPHNQYQTIAGWDFHVVWENSGSTPTQHMTTYKNLLVFDGEMLEEFDFPDIIKPGTQKTNHKTFVGPKAVVDAGSQYVPLNILQAVKAGKCKLYMWGWAEYSNVFQPDRRSRSEYCFEVEIRGELETVTRDDTKPPFEFVIYKKHNGSDSECYRQPGAAIPTLEV